MNKLIQLLDFGQSYWLDNLTREEINHGKILYRVERQGLRGITSNPSIFNKSISGSQEYHYQIESLVKAGQRLDHIYEALIIKDIQDACDLLRPVYDQSGHGDGCVSVEVSPFLAHDTEGTMQEARRLFTEVNRPNCYIKIPGTHEGLPAIEQMLYEGININITLLFSFARYEQVANAYIRALQRRAQDGKSIHSVYSVASIFLSRIDLLVDKLLAQRILPTPGLNPNPAAEKLFGQAGIATARLVYQRFKTIFSGSSWEKLETLGATMQRPLWASTSNKDPLYHDLRYVEPLIGPYTINTLPDKTITAFADHGQINANTIEQNPEQAKDLFTHLKELGIDIADVTQQLEDEGVQKFMASFTALMNNLATVRMKMKGSKWPSQRISAGNLDKVLKPLHESLDAKQIGRLLFAQDPYLWEKPPDQMNEISQRMGWLSLPEDEIKNAPQLIEFADQVKREGFTHVVLLGMGGSSLSSEVARQTFGSAKGYPQLLVLDDTDPAAIKDVEGQILLKTTLFIVASKSGTTAETLNFFYYFFEQVKGINHKSPGSQFVAITDKGTPLVKLAQSNHFRKVFINPSELGGRYSVLSDFGLVPMTLLGIDINAFLFSAREMMNRCHSEPAAINPGISLGAVLGLCQRHGMDKVTFVLSSSIQSFGYWVEQLLAESTGKEGRGLIPVHGERLGPPDVYGLDRIFVHIYIQSDNHQEDSIKLRALEDAGHPIIRIQLRDTLALGGEYYRWEVATAVAGIIMDINPFDQPNVEESKKHTRQLIDKWQKGTPFQKANANLSFDAISIFTGSQLKSLLSRQYDSIGDFLGAFVYHSNPGDYVALLPYFRLTESRHQLLNHWRELIRAAMKLATTCLNGPRYLHSTGQLHKGGPDSGLFILMTGSPMEDLPIPGSGMGFSVLHEAEALGDFRSLDERGRRVMHIQLGEDIDAGLNQLLQSLSYSIRSKVTEEVN